MARIKIKDLNVDFEELKKRDPKILEKIRGGVKNLELYNGVPVPTQIGCEITGRVPISNTYLCIK